MGLSSPLSSPLRAWPLPSAPQSGWAVGSLPSCSPGQDQHRVRSPKSRWTSPFRSFLIKGTRSRSVINVGVQVLPSRKGRLGSEGHTSRNEWCNFRQKRREMLAFFLVEAPDWLVKLPLCAGPLRTPGRRSVPSGSLCLEQLPLGTWHTGGARACPWEERMRDSHGEAVDAVRPGSHAPPSEMAWVYPAGLISPGSGSLGGEGEMG